MRMIPLSLLTLAVSAACGSNPAEVLPPEPGTIEIRAITSGVPGDSGGYVVQVSGFGEQTLDRNGSFTLRGLLPGQYDVRLSGVAGNCTVLSRNPQRVTVAPGQVLRATFEIACVSETRLVIHVATEGEDPDPDGYLLEITGMPNRAVGDSGTVSIPGISEGTYTVYPIGLAKNCVVEGPDAYLVTVTRGTTKTLAIKVGCPHLGPGELLVSVGGSWSGPASYIGVVIDGQPAERLAATRYRVFGPLSAGSHSVRLVPLSWCWGTGTWSAVVSVPADQGAAVRFSSFSCLFIP